MYTQYDEDTNMFYAFQTTLPGTVVYFGPLSTTLSNLADMGYSLEASWTRGDYYNRTVKVFLVNRPLCEFGRFKVATFKNFRSSDIKRLSDLVKPNTQLINRNSSMPTEITREIKIDGDPWETLRERYPVKDNRILVGNQTLEEYLSTN